MNQSEGDHLTSQDNLYGGKDPSADPTFLEREIVAEILSSPMR